MFQYQIMMLFLIYKSVLLFQAMYTVKLNNIFNHMGQSLNPLLLWSIQIFIYFYLIMDLSRYYYFQDKPLVLQIVIQNIGNEG